MRAFDKPRCINEGEGDERETENLHIPCAIYHSLQLDGWPVCVAAGAVGLVVIAVVMVAAVLVAGTVEDVDPLDALIVSLTVFVEYVCVESSVSVVLLTQY